LCELSKRENQVLCECGEIIQVLAKY